MIIVKFYTQLSLQNTKVLYAYRKIITHPNFPLEGSEDKTTRNPVYFTNLTPFNPIFTCPIVLLAEILTGAYPARLTTYIGKIYDIL